MDSLAIPGELFLYVSRQSKNKASKSGTKANPVIGIYSRTSSFRNIKRETLCHVFEGPALMLLPGSTRIDNFEFPLVSPGRQTIEVHSIVYSAIGKKDILDYLETRPNLNMHSNWIRELKRPYLQNFPIPRLSHLICPK